MQTLHWRTCDCFPWCTCQCLVPPAALFIHDTLVYQGPELHSTVVLFTLSAHAQNTEDRKDAAEGNKTESRTNITDIIERKIICIWWWNWSQFSAIKAAALPGSERRNDSVIVSLDDCSSLISYKLFYCCLFWLFWLITSYLVLKQCFRAALFGFCCLSAHLFSFFASRHHNALCIHGCTYAHYVKLIHQHTHKLMH